MYKVYSDNTLIHDGSSPSEKVHLISPTLKLGDNIAGTFESTMPPTTIGYNACEKLVSTISVKEDEEYIWRGRILKESKDMWNNRRITCEGALSFLNDSTQDLVMYANRDLRYFITSLINNHNAKVDYDRQIIMGTVTVVDDMPDYVYETSYRSTYEEMKQNFLDRLGGHLRIRYRQTDGVPILDYLADYPQDAEQTINFGKNLLDFTRDWDVSNLCTVILPKGKQLDEENELGQKDYVNISSVNGGNKYLASSAAVQTYGRIERVVEFSDCETPSLLKQLATAYLSGAQFDDMTIRINALDLHFLNPSIKSFRILDRVRCISAPHGMDRYFPITEAEIPLDRPDSVRYTLGDTSASSSMTGSNISAASTVDKALRTITPTKTVVNMAKQEMGTLLVDYAHITNGIIDNATIDHANIDGLEANYAHISDGLIDNAKISYADVDQLQSNYAHITNGVIDNAYIDVVGVRNLDANYAHITDGVIDNARMSSARIDDLDNKFAHIENGIINNATIDQADVNNLQSFYAHVTDGVIDNAEIGYAKVKELDTHYALIDMSNTNNAWIRNGVIKDGVITNAMILNVSANKLTAGDIDASVIRVYNLNADNITVGTLNGQRISNASVDLSKLAQAVYTQVEIDSMIDALNDRIESAIETWTGDAVPSLINLPASGWNTTSEKDAHIGDIYYVVNPNLPENGYAYRFASINGTYSWQLIQDSDITSALRRLQVVEGKVVNIEQFDSDISSWKTSTDNEISSIKSAHTTLSATVDKAVKSMVQLWYARDVDVAPPKPGQHITNTSTDSGAWTLSVPVYDGDAPNYFYCYEYEYMDGTYGWSNVVYDQAMSDTQVNAQSGIISSVQLWTISDTTDLPNPPEGIGIPLDVEDVVFDYILDSSDIELEDGAESKYYSNSNMAIEELIRGNHVEYLLDSNGLNVIDDIIDPYLTSLMWSVEVPTYDFGRPNYFYCWEYRHRDGTVSWSDVIFDKATTEAQRKSAEIADELTVKVDVTTFNEVKQTTDSNSARITRLSETVDNNNTTTSQTINEIIQNAESTTSKISNVTTRLGLNEDGSGTTNDIVAKHAELVQDLDGFRTSVAETYSTKQEVDNMVIGGRNLLRLTKEFGATSLVDEEGDSLYDSDLYNIETSRQGAGYLNAARSKLTFDTKDGLTVRYMNFSQESSESIDIFAQYDDVVIPEVGESYILSFYVKGSNSIVVTFDPRQNGETVDTITSQGVSSEALDGEVLISTNSLWSRVWVKWTIRGTASGNYRNVTLKLKGGNIAYVCGLKFEVGTKVTAWTPAPEDVEEHAEDYTEKTISGVLERVTQSETQIVQNTEYIGLKANKSDVYTITQVDGIVTKEISDRTAAIEVSAEEILSTVSNTYVKTTEYDDLEERVSTNTSNIEQQGEQIALKANSTDVYTKRESNNLITTEVEARNAAISAAVSDINLSVSRTYTTKQEFAGLGVGGRNLLRQTEAFTDTYMSDSSGLALKDSSSGSLGEELDNHLTDGASSIVSEKFHSLSVRSLDCRSLAPTTYREFAKYNKVIVPDSGSTYVFSFYAKGSGTIDAYFYPHYVGNTCSAVTSKSEVNDNTDGHVSFTLTSGWVRYWVRWTIGGTQTSGYRHVLLRLFGGNQASVCGLKFEEGNVSSSWSPAPEDLGTDTKEAIDNLEHSITQSMASLKVTADDISSVVSKKTDSRTIISTINQSAEQIKISAEKVNIEGAAIFSQYAQKSEASAEEQYIYIAKKSGTTSVDTPTGWITRADNVYDVWTTKRPKYNTNYPVIFVARQQRMADGSRVCTTPVIDDTTTVIDGGAIITGTIDASRATIINIDADNINTGTLAADRIDTAHIKVSSLNNDSGFQTASQVSTAVTNGISGKADKTAASELTQYIYKSKAKGTTSIPTNELPTGWVTNATGNNNVWTTKRPKYNTSYPVVFISKQNKTVSGTVTYTTPVIDDTTTVIDGGNIISGTVTTGALAASSVTADKISAGAITAAKIASGAITADKISAGAITAAKIASGAITASMITAGTMSGSRVKGGTITGTVIESISSNSTRKFYVQDGMARLYAPNGRYIELYAANGGSNSGTCPQGVLVGRNGSTVMWALYLSDNDLIFDTRTQGKYEFWAKGLYINGTRVAGTG